MMGKKKTNLIKIYLNFKDVKYVLSHLFEKEQ